jgi:transcriptional regulator with XRE-family HTH domain
MVDSQDLQKRVLSVMAKYNKSARKLAEFAGIHPRTLQHWANGETGNPTPENLRKFDQAIPKLEGLSHRSQSNNLIDLTGSSMPIKVRVGNVVLTFEYL